MKASLSTADGWKTTRNWRDVFVLDSHDDFLDSPRKKAPAGLSHIRQVDPQTRQPTKDVWSFLVLHTISTKPVRKKVERDNLIGVPCKLYSRFYAVVDENFRGGSCDHVDSAS